MGTMAARFQRAQIKRIIAPLPAIEGLAADAEMTAGTGHVVAVAIEIHPGQPHPGFPAELHPDPSQSARTGWFPAANLHFDTLSSVTNHSEREQPARHQWKLWFVQFYENYENGYAEVEYPHETLL